MEGPEGSRLVGLQGAEWVLEPRTPSWAQAARSSERGSHRPTEFNPLGLDPAQRLPLQHCSTGRLAQLVQSTCLTSRGSGVRIPQRPLGICGDRRVPKSWNRAQGRLGGSPLGLEAGQSKHPQSSIAHPVSPGGIVEVRGSTHRGIPHACLWAGFSHCPIQNSLTVVVPAVLVVLALPGVPLGPRFDGCALPR